MSEWWAVVVFVGGRACFRLWWAVVVHGRLQGAFLGAGGHWWVVGDHLQIVGVVAHGCHHRLYLFMSVGPCGVVIVGWLGLLAMVW